MKRLLKNLTLHFIFLIFGLLGKNKKNIRRCFYRTSIKKVYQTLKDVEKYKDYNFPINLAVGAIVKNETQYIREWLEYHKLQGVEKFYIFDNESEDDLFLCLEPYIKNGTVEYEKIIGKGVQEIAYNAIIDKTKYKVKWLAFIDVDEFILPLKHKNIPDFLKDFKNYDQIYISWLLYGNSGHIKKPEGLVIENFTYHDDKADILQKSIVKPHTVILAYAHFCYTLSKSVNEYCKEYYENTPSVDIIRVNHYYGKSNEEYIEKIKRGSNNISPEAGYDMEKFEHHNRNQISDDLMKPFIPKIKEALNILK